jgi:hypothetical protein
MIQFKRGKTSSWQNAKPLLDGQPGYDKDRHKLKIGDGIHTWDELPDASGLTLGEILESEAEAKVKAKAKAALNPLSTLISKLLSKDDRPVITYGTETPDDETIGQLYLQYYDSEPETDYVVESGITDIWKYRKWRSGLAECTGTLEIAVTVQEPLGALYCNSNVAKNISYPFAFKEIPTENASICSPSGVIWLANNGLNTASSSAAYSILSTDSHANQAIYKICLSVSGFWR